MGLFDNLFKASDKKSSKVKWNDLTSEQELNSIIKRSYDIPCAIFKHSTRCSISVVAKSRLENGWAWKEDEIAPYYLDLLNYRDISNAVAEKTAVTHQSPQLIILKDGKAIYQTTHSAITIDSIKELFN